MGPKRKAAKETTAPKKEPKKTPAKKPTRKPKPVVDEESDDEDILHFTPVPYNQDEVDTSYAPAELGDPQQSDDLSAVPELSALSVEQEVEDSIDGGGDYADDDKTETANLDDDEDTAESPAIEDEEEPDTTPVFVLKVRKRHKAKIVPCYHGPPLQKEPDSDEDVCVKRPAH